MLAGMRVRMATMVILMRIRRKNHRKLMMDQRRMLRTEGIECDVDGYECAHRDDGDADEDKAALQADDGSNQNVED